MQVKIDLSSLYPKRKIHIFCIFIEHFKDARIASRSLMHYNFIDEMNYDVIPCRKSYCKSTNLS